MNPCFDPQKFKGVFHAYKLPWVKFDPHTIGGLTINIMLQLTENITQPQINIKLAILETELLTEQ